MAAIDDLSSPRFYHGTKADLKQGDLIEPGKNSNYGKRKKAAYVYLTATLDAAAWGAELALGEGPGRIYIVEPTGPIADDPNLTDKKYPGNPTKSYRSRDPLRVTGEVTDWKGHSPEELKVMKDNLERLRRLGVEANRGLTPARPSNRRVSLPSSFQPIPFIFHFIFSFSLAEGIIRYQPVTIDRTLFRNPVSSTSARWAAV